MEMQKEMAEMKTAMKEQSAELVRQLNEQSKENARILQQSQQGYGETVERLQNRLGELQQATRSMMEIGKDISSLQNILRSPKLRGGLGELFLEELLKQILPEEHFDMQYTFSNGAKVDAVIRLGEGLIPVDAKFPLENFRKMAEAGDEEGAKAAKKKFVSDVKKRIDEIASKYILPEEGTFEFAMMYLPAENVYYETIIKDESQNESIAAYAIRHQVIPVSPNSFYAYLQAIVRGLKGMRIERSAKVILEGLGQLESDFQKFSEEFEKVGSHMRNAQAAYDKTEKRFGKLQSRLSIIGSTKQVEALPKKETPAIRMES